MKFTLYATESGYGGQAIARNEDAARRKIESHMGGMSAGNLKPLAECEAKSIAEAREKFQRMPMQNFL